MKTLVYYIIPFLFLISCKESNTGTLNRARDLWNSEAKSMERFDRFYRIVSQHPEYLDSIPECANSSAKGSLDKSTLRSLYFNEVVNTSTDEEIKINLFLENSGSMWGYFNGATECEQVLGKSVLQCSHLFDKTNVSVSFISDKIYVQSVKDQVLEFIGNLEPEKLNTGNFLSTQIADILKTVIHETGKSEVSILVSDCIYSPGNGSDPAEKANFEWVLIEDAFLTMLDEQGVDMSVLIQKYESSFKGKYYYKSPYSNTESGTFLGYGKDFQRPYYVIILGESPLVKTVMDKIEFETFPGYTNSYLISKPKPGKHVDYRLMNSFSIGTFRPDKKDPKHALVKARPARRGPDEGVFQFTVAVDLSDFPLDNTYITNGKNYDLSGNYQIDIEEITETQKKQYKSLRGYSHLLKLRTQELIRHETLDISLKRNMAQWVLDTHTDDDSDIYSDKFQHQTRGFRYLVEGITSAFQLAQKKSNPDLKTDYFTIQIKINT